MILTILPFQNQLCFLIIHIGPPLSYYMKSAVSLYFILKTYTKNIIMLYRIFFSSALHLFRYFRHSFAFFMPSLSSEHFSSSSSSRFFLILLIVISTSEDNFSNDLVSFKQSFNTHLALYSSCTYAFNYIIDNAPILYKYA